MPKISLPAAMPSGRSPSLGDTKLYIPKGDAAYDGLKPMIGGTLNIKHVRDHLDETLRLATSIKQGTVTASMMRCCNTCRR